MVERNREDRDKGGLPVDYQILEEERIADERSHVSPDLGHTISEQPIRNLTSLRDPISVGPDATVAEAIEINWSGSSPNATCCARSRPKEDLRSRHRCGT